MNRIRLGIHGAAGRMGRRIIALARDDERFVVTAAVVRAGSDGQGRDVGLLAGGSTMGVLAQPDLAPLLACDVIIDVSTPAAGAALAEALAAKGDGKLVTGATGWNADQLAILRRAAGRIALLQSGNFSLGITSLCQNVQQTAARLGDGWGVHIHDQHHTAKKDAPSGTALMLSCAVRAGWGRAVEPQTLPIGAPLKSAPGRGEISITVSRVGDVVGTHHVNFHGPNEILQFSHVAQDRDVFANGALAAANWLADQPAGHYAMDDVLVPGGD